MDSTHISKLKQAARTLKRGTGVTHSEALDQVARAEGANDWAHMMRKGTSGLANVEVLPIRKSEARIFHRVRIESMEFSARVPPNGWLYMTVPPSHPFALRAHFGVSSLRTFSEVMVHRRARPGETWVCKHADEARINVDALSEAGRLALVREFGLLRDHGVSFLSSPAFDALVAWSRNHPRLLRALQHEESPYVRGWQQRVIERLAGD